MRLRCKAWLVAASAMAMAAGCEPPKEMSPVAPPGFDSVNREPAIEPGKEAQALGEQASAAVSIKETKPAPKSPPTP